jgi:uncharacterized protein YbjT (DUF2867 family)
MPNTNIIAVFGATGNVGNALLPLLIASSERFKEIRIVTKRPDNNNVMKHASIKVIQGDYCVDQAAVLTALKGCDKMFVLLPQSLTSEDMVRHGKFLGDCAITAGVPTMIRLASFGIDQNSHNYVCSQGPLGDAHVTLENYYSELGLQVVSIRPTSFISNLNFNLQEIRSQSTMSTPLGTSAKTNWVSCKDIAAVVAKVLEPPPDRWDHYGSVIDVTGPAENTLSGPAMAEILTSQRMGSPSSTSRPNIIYKETGIPPSPDYAGLWKFLRSGGFDCHTDSVEQITGKSATKLKDTISSILDL